MSTGRYLNSLYSPVWTRNQHFSGFADDAFLWSGICLLELSTTCKVSWNLRLFFVNPKKSLQSFTPRSAASYTTWIFSTIFFTSRVSLFSSHRLAVTFRNVWVQLSTSKNLFEPGPTICVSKRNDLLFRSDVIKSRRGLRFGFPYWFQPDKLAIHLLGLGADAV